jgi:signal transduction histidine kinase
LSVSQGIVAKHGGKIHVSSEEGSGSVFTVILPVTTFPRTMHVF